MAEAWAKRVTGDEPQGTMGRLQTVGEARCLLPAFFCAHIFIKRETSGYEAGAVRSGWGSRAACWIDSLCDGYFLCSSIRLFPTI